MRGSTVRTALPSSQLMLLSQSMCTNLPCAVSSATTVIIADYSRNATLNARGVTVHILKKRLQVLRAAMVEARIPDHDWAFLNSTSCPVARAQTAKVRASPRTST